MDREWRRPFGSAHDDRITEDGGHEVLGVMVGVSETEVFRTQFLRSLRERGLAGVRLVSGDHHLALVKAIRKVMLGAAYQLSSVRDCEWPRPCR
ncbi:transposase [Streptomyces sp. NPDC059371]|uniref:transposase n=1 Tax=Streptomyces sp. NPDC059371 TaxID=3346812 RepID=UPI003688A0E9